LTRGLSSLIGRRELVLRDWGGGYRDEPRVQRRGV